MEDVHRVVPALQHDRHGGGRCRRAGRQPAVARPAGGRPQAAGTVRPASGPLRSPRRRRVQRSRGERRGGEADSGRTIRAGRSAGRHTAMTTTTVFRGRVTGRPTKLYRFPGFVVVGPGRFARPVRADPVCSARAQIKRFRPCRKINTILFH